VSYYFMGPIVPFEKVTVSIIDFPGDSLSFPSGGFINLFVFSILHFHYKVIRYTFLIVCPASNSLCFLRIQAFWKILAIISSNIASFPFYCSLLLECYLDKCWT
jgi:hypothetical protein